MTQDPSKRLVTENVGARMHPVTGMFHDIGFGVVGDKIHDDTAALQTAVNAAAAAKRPLLVMGTPRLTAPLALPANTHLRFNGPNSGLIRDHATTGAGGGTLINATMTDDGALHDSNIVIEGGYIARKNAAATGKHLSFIGVLGLKIKGLDIRDADGDWMATLKNCAFFSVTDGIWNCNGGTLYNDGLHIYGGHHFTISDMIITAGDDALAITNESANGTWLEHFEVTNCVLESNAAGMLKVAVGPRSPTGVRHGHFSNIGGRKTSTTGSIPIWFYDASPNDDKMYDITVDGLTVDVQNIGGNVVWMQGVDGLRLDNVTVTNPNGTPIYVSGGTNAVNQVFTLTATGGTFTIHDPVSNTDSAAISATSGTLAADIQAAIRAFPNMSTATGNANGDSTVVAGGTAGTFTVTLAPAPSVLGWKAFTFGTGSLTGGTITTATPSLAAKNVRLGKPRVVGTQTAATTDAIRCDDLTDGGIIDAEIKNPTGRGVLLNRCTDVQLRGGVIDGAASYGVNFIATTGCTMRGMRVKNSAQPFAESNTSTYTAVVDNDFRGNTTQTVGTYGGSNIDARNNVGIAVVGQRHIMVPYFVPAAAVGAWPTANVEIGMRFAVEQTMTFRYLRTTIGAASGNVAFTIRKLSGTGDGTATIVKSTGIVACPAAGSIRYDLGAFTLAPGEYVVSIWADNTTVTFPVQTTAAPANLPVSFKSGAQSSGPQTSVPINWQTTANNVAVMVALEADV